MKSAVYKYVKWYVYYELAATGYNFARSKFTSLSTLPSAPSLLSNAIGLGGLSG